MTLPFISKSATKRVKDKLPPHEVCPYCEGRVELVSNEQIYGREYGDWPYVYLCRPCDARVGLHPYTDIPLGTLADNDLREARKSAKEPFQSLWKGPFKRFDSRNEAYKWLASEMNIPLEECHFGWFDEAQCAVAEQICRGMLP